MEQRMKELNCVDVTPPDSPLAAEDDHHAKSKRFLAKPESLDSLACSDSDTSSWRHDYTTDANTKVSVPTIRDGNADEFTVRVLPLQPLLEFGAFDGRGDHLPSPNGSQDSRTYKTKGTGAFIPERTFLDPITAYATGSLTRSGP